MQPFILLSHNTYWFQGVPFDSDSPPEPNRQILQRLCALYRQLNPNVICLQEIQSAEAFHLLQEQLEMPGCYCPGGAQPQYGGAVFWRHDGGGYSHHSRSSSVDTQRMWQVVEVPWGERLLRICNMHLPSQRQIGERAAGQRILELEDALRSVHGGLDILAGDLNEQPDSPTGACLQRHGYDDAAVLSGQADVQTAVSESRSDYIWLRRDLSASLQSFDVVPPHQLTGDVAGKRYLSDHLPNWIALS